jgi:DNA-directed RNA polymerase specialized sigma24 family protein
MDQTGMFFVMCLFAGLCVFLSGICLLLVIKQRRSLKYCGQAIQRLEKELKAAAGAFREPPKAAGTARERPRPDPTQLRARFENPEQSRARVPEKYRYVAQLDRSGLSAAEVSDILDVSEAEAEQMLALARSASKGS